MFCPVCHDGFEAEHHGLFEDILVFRCAGCGMQWMSADSLDRLDDNVSVDASRIEWEVTDVDDGLCCPECVGDYRRPSPKLEPIQIPSHPHLCAHRCTACGGFLVADKILEGIRAVVVGRAVPED
jgi:hypothetical protein